MEKKASVPEIRMAACYGPAFKTDSDVNERKPFIYPWCDKHLYKMWPTRLSFGEVFACSDMHCGRYYNGWPGYFYLLSQLTPQNLVNPIDQIRHQCPTQGESHHVMMIARCEDASFWWYCGDCAERKRLEHFGA